jgi:thiamine kinase-like enzyme
MSVERVKGLPFWTAAGVDVTELPGGITNRNYVVRDGVRRFVVRQCSDGTLLGIDRRNERVCHRAAAEIGVAPALVHHQEEFLVSDFVDGRTLTALDLRDPDCLARAARALQTLHGAWGELRGEMLFFSPFQSVRTYAMTAAQRGAQLPSNLNLILADIRVLESSIAPYRPVLCHNDLLPANLIDAGDAVWIVDWELAGMGHPLFDLGGLVSNADLTDEAADQLLLKCGHSPDKSRRELGIFQAISLLREALWGSVQSVTSSLPVDYQAYAETHFARYRETRAKVR